MSGERSTFGNVRSGPDATLKRRQEPEGDHLRRGPCVYVAALNCAPYQAANRFMRWAKLRTSCCLSLAELTAVLEPVEGYFSTLADRDEVAVGITHVAAPFPAVIV
jgi:hypothetical protein